MVTAIVLSVILLFRLIPMIITGVVAQKKKRRVLIWVLIALFFPLPTLTAVLIVAPLAPCKSCTQCGRISWATAQACPYCNIPMPEGPIAQAPDPASGSRATLALAAFAVFIAAMLVLGILSAIALPQFAFTVAKSQEGAAKGHLGVIRSALALYSRDAEGRFPKTLDELTSDGKYLKEIPAITLPRTARAPGHPRSSKVTSGSLSTGVTDTGGWFYNSTGGTDAGKVVVNCSHQDMSGKRWDQH